jgi:hypothetical protein
MMSVHMMIDLEQMRVSRRNRRSDSGATKRLRIVCLIWLTVDVAAPCGGQQRSASRRRRRRGY